MNKVDQSDGRRSYNNALREEQAQQTRERIVEAALREIADAGPEGVTLAQVARAAGVSEPTLYRHFGSRDRLYDELERHAQERIGLPSLPAGVEEFARHAGAVYGHFGANKELVQAMARAGLGREVRNRGRARRLKVVREMLAAAAPHLDERSLECLTAILRVLVTWETFEKLTGELGLTTEEAAASAEWAVGTLLREVGRGGGPAGSDTPASNGSGAAVALTEPNDGG